MNENNVAHMFSLLKKEGVVVNAGMTNEDIRIIEEATKVSFPSDFKSMLVRGVPYGSLDGSKFPDWASNGIDAVNTAQEFVEHSVIFDIRNNNFWHEIFGDKPQNLDEAVEQARSHIYEIPKVLPVFGHRFLLAEPAKPGNPVLSFVQPTDVIVYGANLLDYFENEFGGKKEPDAYDISHVKFWGDLV